MDNLQDPQKRRKVSYMHGHAGVGLHCCVLKWDFEGEAKGCIAHQLATDKSAETNLQYDAKE